MGPRGLKMEPTWRQDGVKTAKKSKKNANATKKRAEAHKAPPVEPKKRPTWLQVELPNR